MAGRIPGVSLTTLVAFALLSGSAFSAHDSPDLDNIAAELETNRRLLVEENMELDATSGGEFWKVYGLYRQEMGAIDRQLFRLMREFQEHFEELGDARATSLLADYFDLEQRALAIRRTYIPKFNAVLTPRQTLRFFQIEHKLDTIIEADISASTPLVP
jgi:hypothetical protein